MLSDAHGFTTEGLRRPDSVVPPCSECGGLIPTPKTPCQYLVYDLRNRQITGLEPPKWCRCNGCLETKYRLRRFRHRPPVTCSKECSAERKRRRARERRAERKAAGQGRVQ